MKKASSVILILRDAISKQPLLIFYFNNYLT